MKFFYKKNYQPKANGPYPPGPPEITLLKFKINMVSILYILK